MNEIPSGLKDTLKPDACVRSSEVKVTRTSLPEDVMEFLNNK